MQMDRARAEYEKKRQDVAVKLQLLDENRIKVMRQQLVLLHSATGKSLFMTSLSNFLAPEDNFRVIFGYLWRHNCLISLFYDVIFAFFLLFMTSLRYSSRQLTIFRSFSAIYDVIIDSIFWYDYVIFCLIFVIYNVTPVFMGSANHLEIVFGF